MGRRKAGQGQAMTLPPPMYVGPWSCTSTGEERTCALDPVKWWCWGTQASAPVVLPEALCNMAYSMAKEHAAFCRVLLMHLWGTATRRRVLMEQQALESTSSIKAKSLSLQGQILKLTLLKGKLVCCISHSTVFLSEARDAFHFTNCSPFCLVALTLAACKWILLTTSAFSTVHWLNPQMPNQSGWLK